MSPLICYLLNESASVMWTLCSFAVLDARTDRNAFLSGMWTWFGMKTCKYYKSSSNFPSNCFGQSLVRSVRWTDQYGQLETCESWSLRPATNEHSDLSQTVLLHSPTDKDIAEFWASVRHSGLRTRNSTSNRQVQELYIMSTPAHWWPRASIPQLFSDYLTIAYPTSTSPSQSTKITSQQQDVHTN